MSKHSTGKKCKCQLRILKQNVTVRSWSRWLLHTLGRELNLKSRAVSIVLDEGQYILIYCCLPRACSLEMLIHQCSHQYSLQPDKIYFLNISDVTENSHVIVSYEMLNRFFELEYISNQCSFCKRQIVLFICATLLLERSLYFDRW